MIRFNCECGKTLILKGDLHGQVVNCPTCHRSIRVPDLHHAAPVETVGVVSAPHVEPQAPKSPHVAEAAHVVEESTGRIIADSIPSKPLPLPFSVIVIQFAAWIEVIGALFALYMAFFGQLNPSESMSAAGLGVIGLLSCPFLFATVYIARTVHRLEEEILGPRKIVMRKSKTAILKRAQSNQSSPSHERRLPA